VASGEAWRTTNGERPDRWQVTERVGNILDIPVKRRHDKKAAKEYFRRLRRGSAYPTPVIVTGKLVCHGAAKHEVPPGSGTSAASLSQHSGAKFSLTNTVGGTDPRQPEQAANLCVHHGMHGCQEKCGSSRLRSHLNQHAWLRLVPECAGVVSVDLPSREALWDNYYTAAPASLPMPSGIKKPTR
jgi:hypothetical protein